MSTWILLNWTKRDYWWNTDFCYQLCPDLLYQSSAEFYFLNLFWFHHAPLKCLFSIRHESTPSCTPFSLVSFWPPIPSDVISFWPSQLNLFFDLSPPLDRQSPSATFSCFVVLCYKYYWFFYFQNSLFYCYSEWVELKDNFWI